LGAVPGAAELRHLHDHATAAVQVPDEESASGGHQRWTPLVRGVVNQDAIRDQPPYHEGQQDHQGLMNSDPMFSVSKISASSSRHNLRPKNWQIHDEKRGWRHTGGG
jgi:hypothetical protein